MRFVVEPGHVQRFCQVTGDPTPAVGDDVPFAFPCCLRQQDPEHMKNLRPAGPIVTLGDAAAAAMVASDRVEYFGRVRVGETYDVAERRGRAWTKTSASGASLEFSEHLAEWADSTGELVLRTTRVLVVVR
jgi:hypothetical protein